MSATDVLDHEFRQVHFVRDEFAHGVARAREVVGEVRVQALDTDARTPDAAAGLGPVDAHRGATAALGVLLVGLSQRVIVHEVFETVHSPVAFDPTHRFVECGVDEPEERGHRRAVFKVWFVLDDDRPTVESSNDDGAAPRERSSEVALHDGEVAGRGVSETQRQNSRVRTRRETKARVDERCVDVVEALGVTNDETDDGETRGCSPGSPVL
jgi:hypothetical protein